MGDVSGNWTNGGARTGVSGQGSGTSTEGDGVNNRAVTIKVPHLISAVGDKEIIVPITVEGVEGKGVVSYEFDLRYDPGAIQPLESSVETSGTLSGGLFVVTNASEPGLLRVVAYGALAIDGDGVLLNLRFTTAGAGVSVSVLAFERIMFNEGEPGVTIVDGRIELF